MKLDVSNLKVFIHHDGYALKILMPDGSDNFLHCGNCVDIDDVVLTKDLLLKQEINSIHVSIKEDENYFRLELRVPDANGLYHYFHSRKVNLNDVVYERTQIIE